MTSPTQRAGADVQPVACDVVSIDGGIVAQRVSIAYANEMLLALEWEGCSKANFVYSESDYAALQARIAELEARNAASERDAGRYRWLCEGENASVRLNRLPESGIGWPKTLDEAIDAAIDAHAQGHNQGEPC